MPDKLTVIIPVYNERSTLVELVRRLQDVSVADEIVLIDDGSTDGTRELLPGIDGRAPSRVILHERNQNL